MNSWRIQSRALQPCMEAAWLIAAGLCISICSIRSEDASTSVQTSAFPFSSAEAAELFVRKISPLLKSKCLACHGDDEKKIKGGLDMRSRDGLLQGGESGPALRPGDPLKSAIYVAVTWVKENLQMPPKKNDRLSAEEIELLRRWIAAGAPWPAASEHHQRTGAERTKWSEKNTAEGVSVRTSGGLSPEWTNRKYEPEDIWAFQPIRRPPVPEVEKLASESIFESASRLRRSRGHFEIQNPIDAFIQEKLRESELRSARAADKLTLIRRAAFDLTGLPPTPEEIDVFVEDKSPNAFMKLVTRLLDSPHYGEQQARHWLDVVRYADTSGFSNDYERPNAWRYRDYVVRSFNQDKPYDRFILEQIAGDELEPTDGETLIATGFLRMGPWEHTGMTVATITRQQFLNDVTHSMGVSFLGQGLRCASCHDHKFDPVPTRDYYRLQAAFASTQFAERPVPFRPEESATGFSAAKRRAEARLQEAKDAIARLKRKNEDAIVELKKQHGVRDVAELPREDYSRRDNIGLTKEDLTLRKIHEKRRDYFERELKRFEPYAFAVYAGPPNQYSSVRPLYDLPARTEAIVPVVHILAGGAPEAPGESVTPGVLSAMRGWSELELPSGERFIPETVEGRRLALAKWIASSNNTLTARVLVNRIWQQHFGRGLVATANNFGKMGGRPTHPELLDWLASWFMDNGWSLKKLHLLIMTSATYQRSGTPGAADHRNGARDRRPSLSGKFVRTDSARSLTSGGRAQKQTEVQRNAAFSASPSRPSLADHSSSLPKTDPGNALLSHFPARRLTAEEIRDAMLAATGELNRPLGGPGVFPEINWEVALQPRQIMGSVAPAYQPSTSPQERNRRTLYAFRIRTLSDPVLEVLNRPGPETSCERRDETTVTPQVFALFNSEFAQDRALAFATALQKKSRALDDQIRLAFRLCYGRAARREEMRICRRHVAKMLAHHRRHQPAPTLLPTSVRRHMVEEMTGEDVSWEETLDGLKNYQRDLKPWEASPQTRALAELCLVLFNSNEFVYVR